MNKQINKQTSEQDKQMDNQFPVTNYVQSIF